MFTDRMNPMLASLVGAWDHEDCGFDSSNQRAVTRPMPQQKPSHSASGLNRYMPSLQTDVFDHTLEHSNHLLSPTRSQSSYDMFSDIRQSRSSYLGHVPPLSSDMTCFDMFDENSHVASNITPRYSSAPGYEVADYLALNRRAMGEPRSNAPPLRILTQQDPLPGQSRKSMSSFSDRSSSLFTTSDITPLTPISGASLPEHYMSRQTSLGGLSGGVEMLRLHSNMSFMSDLPPVDDRVSFSSYPFGFSDGTDHLVCHADSGVDSMPQSNPNLSLLSFNDDLKASCGSSSEQSKAKSSSGLASTPMSRMSSLGLTNSRCKTAKRRKLEETAPTVEPSLPAVQDLNNDPTERTSKLLRLDSSSGKPNAVAAIPRAPYRRAKKIKLTCSYCNEHPEGFKGDHELHRHISRSHSMKRKYWIAVDKSPDKKFLSKCKHCCQPKKYYADYNLAAHLRRLHFNKQDQPDTKSRRSRGEPIPPSERKGGKSGGDHPSIEWMKENGWLLELEEVLPPPSESTKSSHEEDDDKRDNDSESGSSGATIAYEPQPTLPKTSRERIKTSTSIDVISTASHIAMDDFVTSPIDMMLDGQYLSTTYGDVDPFFDFSSQHHQSLPDQFFFDDLSPMQRF